MPPRMAFLLVAFCVALNAAGFLFHLFEPIPLYDELAHFITPFTLVALVAEIIYRWGGDDEFFPTPQRAIVTGTAIGLLGAVGWEIIEVILGAMGAAISNTLADSIFDVLLGGCGGALGGWFADRYLDRIFGRSRNDPHQRRVRSWRGCTRSDSSSCFIHRTAK